MKLILSFFISLSIYSSAYASQQLTCTVKEGPVEGQTFKLDISEGGKAIWEDEAENQMDCKRITKKQFNMTFRNLKTFKPATVDNSIYYCKNSGSYNVSVLNPDYTGVFYIYKYVFKISCEL